MKQEIAIIGHVDHGKTTLTAALTQAFLNLETKKDTKTINEIIEEQNSIPFIEPPQIELTAWDFKTGKQNRRERREKERKNKK